MKLGISQGGSRPATVYNTRFPVASRVEQIGRLPDAIAKVFITDQLALRLERSPDYLREKLAIQHLANEMSDQPGEVLPRLVQLAMEFCEADSAGVSVLEADSKVFRWLGLHGKLSVFEGATTPRDYSPCGICLDSGGVVLMERPERAYDWISDAKITVPEVLLVPLQIKGGGQLGTLWVVAKDGQRFDAGHARVMTELAGFTGLALRMIQTEDKLKRALEEQEILAKEMSHRVKNVFAIADGLIRVTARNSDTKEQLASSLTGRLQALADAHALVRRSFSDGGKSKGVNLDEIVERILRPYRTHSHISGAPIKLGEHTTNNIALVLHELATNAAKHGALSSDAGSVSVEWKNENNKLLMSWRESAGPEVRKPSKRGFGSTLVKSTLANLKGDIAYEWDPAGLRVTISAPLDGLAH